MVDRATHYTFFRAQRNVPVQPKSWQRWRGCRRTRRRRGRPPPAPP
uniref:Uncharacterized protein n=1 Tax=Arundo donax TaxID=35708 RepID=A0A0A9D4C4_ARUDO